MALADRISKYLCSDIVNLQLSSTKRNFVGADTPYSDTSTTDTNGLCGFSSLSQESRVSPKQIDKFAKNAYDAISEFSGDNLGKAVHYIKLGVFVLCPFLLIARLIADAYASPRGGSSSSFFREQHIYKNTQLLCDGLVESKESITNIKSRLSQGQCDNVGNSGVQIKIIQDSDFKIPLYGNTVVKAIQIFDTTELSVLVTKDEIVCTRKSAFGKPILDECLVLYSFSSGNISFDDFILLNDRLSVLIKNKGNPNFLGTIALGEYFTEIGNKNCTYKNASGESVNVQLNKSSFILKIDQNDLISGTITQIKLYPLNPSLSRLTVTTLEGGIWYIYWDKTSGHVTRYVEKCLKRTYKKIGEGNFGFVFRQGGKDQVGQRFVKKVGKYTGADNSNTFDDYKKNPHIVAADMLINRKITELNLNDRIIPQYLYTTSKRQVKHMGEYVEPTKVDNQKISDKFNHNQFLQALLINLCAIGIKVEGKSNKMLRVILSDNKPGNYLLGMNGKVARLDNDGFGFSNYPDSGIYVTNGSEPLGGLFPSKNTKNNVYQYFVAQQLVAQHQLSLVEIRIIEAFVNLVSCGLFTEKEFDDMLDELNTPSANYTSRYSKVVELMEIVLPELPPGFENEIPEGRDGYVKLLANCMLMENPEQIVTFWKWLDQYCTDNLEYLIGCLNDGNY